MTLKEAGFQSTKAAIGSGMRLALGTLSDGQGAVVAKTPKGEGYTLYDNVYDALTAFDTIVAQAGLTTLVD